MSSEMRDNIECLIDFWALERGCSSILGAEEWASLHHENKRVCRERLRSALLARTEAVADGAWGTVVESRMLNENGLCALAVRTERGELKMGDKLYTHPQDASGDADDAEMFRWLCDNARPWDSDYEQPHALIRICRGEFQGGVGWFNIIGRESRVGIITLRDAVRAAMQAKEAK